MAYLFQDKYLQLDWGYCELSSIWFWADERWEILLPYRTSCRLLLPLVRLVLQGPSDVNILHSFITFSKLFIFNVSSGVRGACFEHYLSSFSSNTYCRNRTVRIVSSEVILDTAFHTSDVVVRTLNAFKWSFTKRMWTIHLFLLY